MVADSAALDRETSERVRAVVFATTAAGAYDYANVWITVVDINDNGPRFFQERYQSKVWENSMRGTFVAQVRVMSMFSHSRIAFSKVEIRWW